MQTTTTTETSFTIPHYRITISSSYWDIVYRYQGEIEKVLGNSGYNRKENQVEVEDVDCDDGKCVNIIYNKNDINIKVTILACNAENYISVTDHTVISDESLNLAFQQMLQDTAKELIEYHKIEEDKLEEEFQDECAIEYARDHMR